jgi:hypothetical protein
MLPTQEQRELEMETLRWMLGERKGRLCWRKGIDPLPSDIFLAARFLAAGFLYEMDACGLGWRHDPGAN